MSLESILNSMSNLGDTERSLISDAYQFAEEAHRHQVRKSGEPYFIHLDAVAELLAKMGLDVPTVAAGLLHDVVEDTDISLALVAQRFGAEIALLVDGVTKLDTGEAKMSEAEYLQKTLVAMNADVRVILVKLADRLHNMRTLGSLKPARRVEIAQETLKLFAPLANHLGIRALKSELEDLSFRYIEPDIYTGIHLRLEEMENELQTFSSRVIALLKAKLAEYGIRAKITPHPRYVYTIYSQMKNERIPFEETFGIRSVRVVVGDMLDCYRVVGIVHQLWRPINGRFADFIATPKDQFYQSLHTGVMYEDGLPLVVQVRTYEMDENAQYGVAAYWRNHSSDHYADTLQRRLRHLSTLMEPARSEDNAEDFVRAVMKDIGSDRVYAVTPKGDIIDLPRGATPIDFAYHIHTEVGHRCRGARVNSKLVALDYQVQNGDRIEIYTINRGGPSVEWLDESLGYVYTNRARISIRAWFRRQQREQIIEAGRAVLEEKSKQLGLDALDYETLCSQAGFTSIDDMLERIGSGTISAAQVLTPHLESVLGADTQTELTGIPILGVRGYAVKLARCCKPKPTDDIIGHVTRATKVTVHRAACPLLNAKNNNTHRLIAVRWGGHQHQHGVFRVPVILVTLDRTGMMGDIGSVVAGENVNMANVNILTENGLAHFYMTMEIDSYSTLSRVLTKIEALEGVIQARRRASA